MCQVLVEQEGYHGSQTLLISLAKHDHICSCENLLTFETLPTPTACSLFGTALPVIILTLHTVVKERESLFLKPASCEITSYPQI